MSNAKANNGAASILSDEEYNAEIKIAAVRRWVKCLCCDDHVRAKLVLGSVAAPHIPRLADKLYFLCRECRNFVGCWHNKDDMYIPIGTIPTKEVQAEREIIYQKIQSLVDAGHYKRTTLYTLLSKKCGWRDKFGVAKINSVMQAKNIIKILDKISDEISEKSSDLI